MEFILHQLLVVLMEWVNYCLFVLRLELILCADFWKLVLHSFEIGMILRELHSGKVIPAAQAEETHHSGLRQWTCKPHFLCL